MPIATAAAKAMPARCRLIAMSSRSAPPARPFQSAAPMVSSGGKTAALIQPALLATCQSSEEAEEQAVAGEERPRAPALAGAESPRAAPDRAVRTGCRSMLCSVMAMSSDARVSLGRVRGGACGGPAV